MVYNVYCLKHKVWVRPADLYPRHEYCEFAIPEPEPTLPQRLIQTDSQAEGSQNASGDPKRKANT